jgi:phage tail-like protein
MAQFSVNPKRFDPYKYFKFRTKWDGRYVAGVSKISGLRRTTEVIEHREGGDPSSSRKSPGRTEYAPITLERGVTHDPEFENWANKVWSFGAGLGAEVSLKDFRKDLTLEVYNEAGQLVLAYKIYRCWVSEYQILPDVDANAARYRYRADQAGDRRLGARPFCAGTSRAIVQEILVRW